MKLRRSLYARPEIIQGQHCTTGAFALIDVDESSELMPTACSRRSPNQVTNRSRRSPRSVLIRPRLVICWQIAGKRRLGALRARNRPGTRPGLGCWFGVEPPAGIEPATPSLPSMVGPFGEQRGTSLRSTEPQVASLIGDREMGYGEAVCGAAAGKSLARMQIIVGLAGPGRAAMQDSRQLS
jgi:hypothetical protein